MHTPFPLDLVNRKPNMPTESPDYTPSLWRPITEAPPEKLLLAWSPFWDCPHLVKCFFHPVEEAVIWWNADAKLPCQSPPTHYLPYNLPTLQPKPNVTDNIL